MPRVLALTALLPALAFLAADAGPSDLDRLAAVSPSVKGASLPPKDWKVFEWKLGPMRQRRREPVEAESVLAFGPTYYVKVRGSARRLVGLKPREKENLVECEQSFEDLDKLLAASAFAKLPAAPNGFALRELVRLPAHPTRLASDGTGRDLYVLCVNGDVWRYDFAASSLSPFLRGEQYLDKRFRGGLTIGMCVDAKNRLYVVANEQDSSVTPVANRVTIYRSRLDVKGEIDVPKPWLRASYPWGIGPFNHGVGHIAQGPDGLLYANSGSRTDGNESGDDPKYAKTGEDPLTACIWRIDPEAEKPEIAVHARGLRNAYGFCWNEAKEMIATDNGPDADPAEELNVIVKDGHYGFPFAFSDWTKKPYKHTPEPPKGVTFRAPIRNVGPAGGGTATKPLSTFDAHSSPSGIVYLKDREWGELRSGYLVARFGNLLDKPTSGFDVLHVRLKPGAGGEPEATTTRLLAPIARPVDVHLCGKAAAYVCEYSRQVENKGYAGMLPGRVLELKAK